MPYACESRGKEEQKNQNQKAHDDNEIVPFVSIQTLA